MSAAGPSSSEKVVFDLDRFGDLTVSERARWYFLVIGVIGSLLARLRGSDLAIAIAGIVIAPVTWRPADMPTLIVSVSVIGAIVMARVLKERHGSAAASNTESASEPRHVGGGEAPPRGAPGPDTSGQLVRGDQEVLDRLRQARDGAERRVDNHSPPEGERDEPREGDHPPLTVTGAA